MRTRELTPSEERAVALLKALEYVIDQKKLSIKLTMTPGGVDTALKIPELRLLKSEYDSAREMWYVTLNIENYMRYIDYAITQMGMSMLLDGSLLTRDNVLISNDYLNR